MERYRVLCELNRKQLFGEEIAQEEIASAVALLLQGIDLEAQPQGKAGKSAKAPLFYMAPKVEGKKPRLWQGYLPKTALLYQNHYELEILRLLALYAGDDPAVQRMCSATRQRLSKAEFGRPGQTGEQLATGICALRFLAAVGAEEASLAPFLAPLCSELAGWGQGQVSAPNAMPLSYLLMALADTRSPEALCAIGGKKEWITGLLRRGWITGRLSNGKISEGDTYNLLGKYILRYALSVLPGCADIASCEIYVDPADDRCYCRI